MIDLDLSKNLSRLRKTSQEIFLFNNLTFDFIYANNKRTIISLANYINVVLDPIRLVVLRFN